MGLREDFDKIWPTLQEPEKADWVEQRIFTKDAPRLEGQCLDSGNHSFYIGKIVPPKKLERGARIVLGEDSEFAPNETYSPEIIKAALAVLFEHLKAGEKVRFKVGQSMNEYCNGKKSTADALSYEQEVELIEKLAREHFQADESNFELVDVFDNHIILSRAFGFCKYDEKTGRIDLKSFFRQKEIVDGLVDAILKGEVEDFAQMRDAYVFAELLYMGAQEDPKFLQQIKSLPTENLKALRTAPETELDPIDAYGLFEIAIRLADAAKGVTFQGGVDRQGKYDVIIKQLLLGLEKKRGQGSKRRSKINPIAANSRALQALVTVLEGTPFRTFYVDRKNNFYQKQALQQRARTRFGLLAAAGLATAAGLTLVGQETVEYLDEKAAEERVQIAENYFEKHWPGYQCMMYDSWDRRPYSKIAANLIGQIETEFSVRYGFDEKTSAALALQIVEKLANRNTGMMHHSICKFLKSKRMLVEFIDQYVHEHHLAVNLSGDEIRRPYEDLRQYRDLFEETATQDCYSLNFDLQKWPVLGFPSTEPIGTYSDSYEFSSAIVQRDLYIYDSWEGPVLMATHPTYKEVRKKGERPEFSYMTLEENGEYLSAEQGCIVAKGFVEDVKSYELSILETEKQTLMFDVFRPGTASQLAHFEGEGAWPGPDYYARREVTVPNFYTDGEWTLAVYAADELWEDRVLIAKRPGEDEFSLEAAKELACWRSVHAASGLWPRSRNHTWEHNLHMDIDLLSTCLEPPNSFEIFD